MTLLRSFQRQIYFISTGGSSSRRFSAVASVFLKRELWPQFMRTKCLFPFNVLNISLLRTFPLHTYSCSYSIFCFCWRVNRRCLHLWPLGVCAIHRIILEDNSEVIHLYCSHSRRVKCNNMQNAIAAPHSQTKQKPIEFIYAGCASQAGCAEHVYGLSLLTVIC